MNTAVTEQAPAPSVEERAAAIFGEPMPKAAQAPEADPTEQTEEVAAPNDELSEVPEATEVADETFEFEHEGAKYALPKGLEKALTNNRDYTQKSQELANQRRMLEVMSEQAKAFNAQREFEASIASEMQQLAAYDSVLAQQMDMNLPEGDLLKAMLQRNQWKEQREAIARSVNAKHQQFRQDYEKSVNDLRAKALEAVTKRIPGWNEALWTSIREHAKSDGYTDSELSAIADPRHQVTLWKAQQYDALKSKATKVVTDGKALKATPSSRPMPKDVQNKLNFRKQINKTQPGSMERRKLVEGRAAEIFSR